MSLVSRLAPATVEGQMIAVLAISLILLFGTLTTLEVLARDTPTEWAESPITLNRLKRMRTALESIDSARRVQFLQAMSSCHDGHTLTEHAFGPIATTVRTDVLRRRIAQQLALSEQSVSVGHANLTRDDFSYGACSESEVSLPMSGIVVSVRLGSGKWLNTEVHPHEWHSEIFLASIFRYGAVAAFVGVLAIFLMHRLSKPLNNLTRAARQFGEGLKASPVPEIGPPDLRRAIESFNAMQQQVADEVKKRIDTLAAISHDLRTPLTGLRIKAELVDDDERRADLVASIDRMESIIASALAFLRGESRSEPLRNIDLSAMLASECSDSEAAGQRAEYIGETSVHYTCRSEALACAVRNLIDNANKYGDGAKVDLRSKPESLDISVSDTGSGIPQDQFRIALEPFRRLSKARENHRGGFGLGLAVAQAISKGHNGDLILAANEPSGLIATIRLPITHA